MIKVIQRQQGDISQFSDAIPILLKRIYASRGISCDAQLARSLRSLLGFDQFKGMDRGVQMLAKALANDKHIMIVGDFDVDGATSTTLSILALRLLGGANISYLIPSRFDDGYGLTPSVVEQAHQQDADLILTVDNGISSIEGVACAHQLGIEVVVTDHHLPGMVLPEADAIINPNLPHSGFASGALAGVGVAFYTMMALRKFLREEHWFENRNIAEPNLARFLDLVALGTIADVVPLDMNNRILVHQGLLRIQRGVCRPGITALIEVAGKKQSSLASSDLGFSLGPRLNAAGRLDSMSLGIELLLSSNLIEAKQKAIELDALNQSRKEIEESMKIEAMGICEKLQFEEESMPMGLVLFHPEWHQGVIGIIASRIKDRYHRPTIVFAQGEDGLLKGSCRSIPHFHMRDALEAINTVSPGLMLKFGGHAMAAGLSIEKDQLDFFTQAFATQAKVLLHMEDLQGVLVTDGTLDAHAFNINTAEMIRDAGPWGQNFPEPLFEGKFKILNQKLVGRKHLKLMLEPCAGGPMIDAIAFNIDLNIWPDASRQEIDIVYKLDINHFRGQSNLQLIIEYIA